NFMPCVLPVISLKLRGMMPSPAAAADLKTQKRGFRHHNLFFALGMLFYFVLLAAIVSYTGMAWGEIFQNSWAIVALSSIVFALSLSLFGVYDLPLIDFKSTPGSSKSPTLEALFTGFLATLLATPCSGPFLGGVLAWALIQPPVTIAAVLLSIGLGMASPYLCLSIFPGLVRFMPRPGKWTRHLENGLGFVLLATTVYLLGLLPEDLILSTLLLFLSIAAAAWIWGIASAPGVSRAGKGLAALVGAGLVIASLFFLAAGAGPSGEKVWKEFDKENFLARLGKSPVVVEFTAEWCPNCKYLERTVLTDKNIAPLQEKYGIKFFRTDLTREHPQGEALLRKMNSKSIPLLAIFPKHNPHEAIILRDIFTQSELKNALDSALSGEGNTVLD
ncbi:MAG: protein-disulfide reductase DsbD family protein, partial [Thermodesulfobacteriota bacterium]